jgi:hypothetical protein
MTKKIRVPALNVNILYNRSNPFGLAADATVLEELLRSQTEVAIGQVHHVDPREPPRAADLQFHLEVPVYGACPWAAANILIANPEHYVASAYDAYKGAFDAIWTRCPAAAAAHGWKMIRWCLPAATASVLKKALPAEEQQIFLALIGGSQMKADGLAALIPAWEVGDPELCIYTTRSDLADQLESKKASQDVPIKVICKDLSAADRLRLQRQFRGHIVASKAEGFGYAAAEGEAADAFLLLSDIPVFQSYYSGSPSAAFIGESADIRTPLIEAFRRFAAWQSGFADLPDRRSAAVADFTCHLSAVAATATDRRSQIAGPVHLPPILHSTDCPPISIVTLTYNRRNFIDLACLNLLLTDYPRDKIEWIVVEDSDDQDKAASDKILGFAAKNPDIQVSYVPLIERTTIGEKRNKGVERAMHDIILFMDDDDVYPATSFRRRVAWLTRGSPFAAAATKPEVATTTMLAMYDLRTGQSAVNVPPFNIPLGQRVSEASLTFYKSFWAACPFPKENVAEGEGWLKGRESAVIEMPPQQILVALSHGANISSRAIPADARVGCFWGWDEAMLRFVHGRIGVAVEAEKEEKKTSTAAKKTKTKGK